jgi:hypothetical protein
MGGAHDCLLKQFYYLFSGLLKKPVFISACIEADGRIIRK